jgi:cysteine desulfurase
MKPMRYLDANASQPLRPAARDAVLAAFEVAGNPSSVHRAGREARRILEDARETIAAAYGAPPGNLVFTSGGSEADAAAIHALSPRRRLIISAIEHDAVRAAAGNAVILPVGSGGVVDLASLEQCLHDDAASLVCLMLANNETGVIQPVADAARLCRRFGALLHVDAVQAAGRMPVHLDHLRAHSLAISSHKIGGPVGIGALILAPDAPFGGPLIAGGGQERSRRGGTPAVPLAAGFAAAVVHSGADDLLRIARLRDAAEQAAIACGAVVCGDPDRRLPNTTCLALPGAAAGVQVIALDLEGVAVSAGAACSSGKVQTSHVLKAMNLGPLAAEAIRVSLPWNVSDDDISAFADAYHTMAARLPSGYRPHALNRRVDP